VVSPPVEAVWGALTRDAEPFPRDEAVRRRPAVSMNMVVTPDGRTSVDGRTAGITGAVDQALLHRLRAQADAVLVGARTVRVEGYGRLLPEGLAYARSGPDRESQPLLIVPTRDAARLAGGPALEDRGSALLLATPADVELPASRRDIRHMRLPATSDGVDLAFMLERLVGEHHVRRIICEGGPTLAGGLLRGGLVDELYVTISPRLGGEGPTLPLATGGLGAMQLTLLAVASADGFVFLRYRVASS
jgi:riboflavin biosynthesis pyrimidine reductase